MITEYESEPVPGLPGNLPAGERILWQGKPEWQRLAVTAFHVRLVAAYFVALAGFGAVQAIRGIGTWQGSAITIGVGVLCVGLLYAIAWGSARTTVYTLTNKRLVMRIGIALPTCINLPLTMVGSAALANHGDGTGDIALRLSGKQRLGWIALWPHARPWKLSEVQPMLRSIADAGNVAGLISRTTGIAQGAEVESSAPRLAVAA